MQKSKIKDKKSSLDSTLGYGERNRANNKSKFRIVISLGGSIVAPKKGPDAKFVLQFAKTLKKFAKDRQFFIAVGGGKVNRNYNAAARSVGLKNKDALDRIGLKATQLNAQFVASILGTKLKTQLLDSLKDPFKVNHVVVSGGFPPLGRSTDGIAIDLAIRAGVGRIINLSNIDYVYDRDPKKFKSAKKLASLSWKEFKKLCGGVWKPGINSPFDPVASKQAEKQGLEVIVASGRNLNNLEKIIRSKPFRGTQISNNI